VERGEEDSRSRSGERAPVRGCDACPAGVCPGGSSRRAEIVVALAGNPNVGKSTLFNALTGMRQHVGNWPGKTVEKKEGVCRYKGRTLRIVDLPGAYSLTAHSMEEMIARDFVMHGKPDVVVDIVDASNLERNLYLTLQTLELTDRVVIALNMTDVAEARGLEIDAGRLSEILGVPVVPTVADKLRGIEGLLAAAVGVAEGEVGVKPYRPNLGPRLEGMIREIEEALGGADLGDHPRRWFAIKLLENDSEALKLAEELEGGRSVLERVEVMRGSGTLRDTEVEIAERRYEIIGGIVKEVVGRKRAPREEITERIDKIVVHKLLGLPLMFGILGATFLVTFGVSAPLVEAFGALFDWLGGLVRALMTALGAPEWVSSLVVDGIIAGVGGVMSFLPLIAIFFLVFAFLEDCGYVARVAFLMDRVMHAVGLHGRTFLCLLVGLGCNVPGIMATRTLEQRKDRLITILITPLIPCGARLGVMTFLVAVFFTGYAATLVMLSLLGVSFALVALVSLLLRRFVLPGEHPVFIIELPPYHRPTVKGLVAHSWERTGVFVMRAGTIIVLASVMIWALSNFPSGVELGDTLIGQIGKLLEPVGIVMGFDWLIMIALLTGFVAKELTLATLGILYGLGEEALAPTLTAAWTPLVAYTFLVVQMIYIPCVASVAILRREAGGWKWAIFGVAYNLTLAFAVGAVVYNAGLLLGLSP